MMMMMRVGVGVVHRLVVSMAIGCLFCFVSTVRTMATRNLIQFSLDFVSFLQADWRAGFLARLKTLTQQEARIKVETAQKDFTHR
jgi:hypothetical protein